MDSRKFVLESNILSEVKKVNKAIEDNSVVYSWYTEDWERLEVYDMENWKIAPIVKYLITGQRQRRWIWLYIIIIIWIIFIIWLFWVLFFWDDKKDTKTNTATIKPVDTTVIQSKIDKQKVENVWPVDENMAIESQIDEWIINSVYMPLWENERQMAEELERLQNQIWEDCQDDNLKMQLETLSKEFDNIVVQNDILNSKNEKLQNIVDNLPSDDFVYYLGTKIYENCNKDDISENYKKKCKDIFFDFQLNVKNK